MASLTIDVGTRSPLGRDHPGENPLVAGGGDESAVYPGLSGAVAHDRGVRTPADEQLDRLDQHGLAGTGFTGDRGQTCTERQLDAFDDPEILDVEFRQHCVDLGSAIGEAELGLQDLVIVLVAEAHEVGGRLRWGAPNDVAVVERRDRLAVEHELGDAVAGYLDLDGLGTGRAPVCGRTACAATPA